MNVPRKEIVQIINITSTLTLAHWIHDISNGFMLNRIYSNRLYKKTVDCVSLKLGDFHVPFWSFEWRSSAKNSSFSMNTFEILTVIMCNHSNNCLSVYFSMRLNWFETLSVKIDLYKYIVHQTNQAKCTYFIVD